MGKMMVLQMTIFILLVIGFIVKRKGIVDQNGQKNLTDLVINVILPCNIINSFLNGASPEVMRDCMKILLLSIGIQIFCVIYGKIAYRKEEQAQKACLQYAIICSNAGFLGNPIAEGVYGSLGLMYASVYLIPLRIMMWSEGIAIFSRESDWKSTLYKVVTHPCIIACAIGIVLMVTGTQLPEVILSPIQALARCNTGLSMLVIGMILEEVDLHTMIDRKVIVYSIHRLIVIPAVVYLACLLLGIDGVVRGVCVLLAAMPAGATTTMLAAKYNQAPQFATKLVVFSTLCSIPAIMIWSMILG